MDERDTHLREALKADAAAIPADVSPALSARLQASIAAEGRPGPGPAASGAASGADRHGFSFWWVSTLTGIAAALAVIAFLNLGGTPPPDIDPIEVEIVQHLDRMQPETVLDVAPAMLTEPLEEELEKLKEDLEKARSDIEEELRNSF